MGYRPGRKLRAPQRDRVSTPVSSWLNFTPAFLGDLAIWLDATDTSTITQSGGAVSQWNDKSGNGRNVAQGTGSKQPSFQSQARNNQNVIRFDGSSDALIRSTADASLDVDSRSVFIVSYQTVGTNEGVQFDVGFNYALSQQGTTGAWYGVVKRTFTCPGVGVMWLASIIDTADGAPGIARVNGREDITLGNQTTSSSSTGAFGVGAVADGTSLFFNGDIGEILVYTRALTNPERKLVEQFLISKWKIV